MEPLCASFDRQEMQLDTLIQFPERVRYLIVVVVFLELLVTTFAKHLMLAQSVLWLKSTETTVKKAAKVSSN